VASPRKNAEKDANPIGPNTNPERTGAFAAATETHPVADFGARNQQAPKGHLGM